MVTLKKFKPVSHYAVGVVLIAYSAMSALTYGAVLGEFENEFPDLSCRRHQGMAVLFGLLPVGWIIIPFVTGFYEHGLQFTCPTKTE